MRQDFEKRLEVVLRESTESSAIKLSECALHINNAAGRTAMAALEMGGWLEAAHEIHKGTGRDGRWSTWLDENVSFITIRTADRYRAIYRKFRSRRGLVSRFELAALHELAKESTPTKAIDHALLEADRGEFVTAKVAKNIIRTFTKAKKKVMRRKKISRPQTKRLKVAGGTVTVSITGDDVVAALQDAIKKLQQDSDTSNSSETVNG